MRAGSRFRQRQRSYRLSSQTPAGSFVAHHHNTMNTNPLLSKAVSQLRAALPELLGIWVFGSEAAGTTGPESDLDLAILLPQHTSPEGLWELAQGLASQAGREVDLVDLGQASTVLQYQVVAHGRLLWAADAQAAIYESFILSEKTALDEARAPLLNDIRTTGSVYDR